MKKITTMRTLARSIVARRPRMTWGIKEGCKLDAAPAIHFGYSFDDPMVYLEAWFRYTANYAYWSDSGILILVEGNTEVPIGHIEPTTEEK